MHEFIAGLTSWLSAGLIYLVAIEGETWLLWIAVAIAIARLVQEVPKAYMVLNKCWKRRIHGGK